MANSRLGIATNLPTGATHDLLLIDHVDGYPEGKLEFRLLATPRKITGIQKVAQLFLKVLFTRKGSDVINFGLGTYFGDYTIGANRTKMDKDTYLALTNEVREAEQQCISILNVVGTDVASQLRSVTVLGLDLAKESIVMYLRLLTEAGVGAQISLPFPQLDLKLSGD